ncbi:CotH kinase family protein [Streptomyces sp. SID8352]|uniref:CotH kinase family protein n=1 Tax=Streptomyces sp. SID8352 TaxID=2690338 RepID=UPI001369B626|nr:CotH kinase family protein [Streptomyces sp. SID8352]MYU26394.1 spore coat protein CotH [Streptomyces sp. SID8352]
MAGGTRAPHGRRLKDRLPVRLRHHWKPVASLGVGLAAMVCFLGDARVSPYVTSASRVEADAVTDDVGGTVGLYDASVTHSLRLTYRQTDFDKMMKEFKEDGAKEYIRADLVIDGVRLDDVGIRLKGNSTLGSLRGRRGMPGGGRGGPPGGAPFPAQGTTQGAATGGPEGAKGGDRPEPPPDGFPGGPGTGAPGTAGSSGPPGPPDDADAGVPGPPDGAGVPGTRDGVGGAVPPGGADRPGGPGGGPGGMVQYNLSAKQPEELPWLVKIDEFVEGRAYQGEREISLRPGSNAQVPLNEALSLSLIAESGQKSERYAFTRVKVNDRPAVARLMVESPGTDYADDLADGNGVLYKAKAGGSFAYRGDDPSEYESSFKQLNKKGSRDLEPVMKLIKWVDNASDEEFARHLGDHVDVDSLALYAASQNLLLNFDDMAGPGKNYLLWYDLDTKKFSVLGWDYNLTFGGDATAGPRDPVGPVGLPGGGAPGGGRPGGAPPGAPPGGAPEGMPEGMPKGISMGHILKSRFLETDAFDGVYRRTYQELYRTFYGSGAAARELRTVTGQARAAGAGSRALDAASAKLATTISDRTTALAKDKEVNGATD